MKVNLNSSTQKTPSNLGTVYCCATPIGSLSDCSQTLLNVLSHCDLIAAEDTRVAQKLLSQLSISKPCIRVDAHTESTAISKLLPKLEDGQNIALLSDAGTLNICDPGAELCRQLHEKGIPLIPVVGPSSLAGFLSVCGIRADRFYFGGFFPRSHQDTHSLPIISTGTLCIFFESPKRILKTAQFLKTLPIDSFFAIKEMSKSHESYWTDLDSLCKDLDDPSRQKGEWVFGFTCKESQASSDDQCIELVKTLKEKGFSLKDTVYITTQLMDFAKNTVYDAYHHSDA